MAKQRKTVADKMLDEFKSLNVNLIQIMNRIKEKEKEKLFCVFQLDDGTNIMNGVLYELPELNQKIRISKMEEEDNSDYFGDYVVVNIITDYDAFQNIEGEESLWHDANDELINKVITLRPVGLERKVLIEKTKEL